MNINNPPILDHIKETNGLTLRCKAVNIGPWNMDSTAGKSIAHGLIISNMISLAGVIFSDSIGRAYSVPFSYDFAGDDVNCLIDGLNFVMARKFEGYFDSTFYDDPVMNRGNILVWYFG